MAQGVVLLFDGAADAAIRSLWSALDEAGVGSLGTYSHRRHHPHVSLVVADAISSTVVARVLARSLRIPRALTLDGVGAFVGRVLFLGVVPAPELLEASAEIGTALGRAGVDIWSHYRPGQWIPHCTLTQSVPQGQFGVAVDRVLNFPLPLVTTISGIALVDDTIGEILWRAELGE